MKTFEETPFQNQEIILIPEEGIQNQLALKKG
jgi:hypothetical protein